FLESRKGSGVYVAYQGAHSQPPSLSSTASEPDTALPFALGLTSVDVFPMRLWQRLQSRRWKSLSSFSLHEGNPVGWIGLREAIAAHAAMTRGLQCSPDQVIVTNCIPAGIELAARALGLMGKTVWMEDPGYSAVARSLQYAGALCVAVPVDASGIDVEAGRRLAPSAKAAFVTPACQFPANVVMSKATRSALLAWAHETDSWILEDDFAWYSVDPEQALRPLAAMDGARTIYVNSFNHTLFPSLRIGYVIVPEPLIARFVDVQNGMSGSSNIPNQMVLADFINQGHLDEHIKQLKESRQERYAALDHALQTHLAQYLAADEKPSSSHITCSLKQGTVAALLAECQAQNIVVEPMSKYRLNGTPSGQIVLGCHGFTPKVIADAAAKLRAIFAAIDPSS
ncbi:MAG TPA: PLP-dependent aminotransferase family protein, partial [Rhizomicrobium sp.]